MVTLGKKKNNNNNLTGKNLLQRFVGEIGDVYMLRLK